MVPRLRERTCPLGTETHLLQSQDLDRTQVTEAFGDLLQRKAGQDQSRTCVSGKNTKHSNLHT